VFELGKIIGKKIVAIKAYQSDRRIKTGLYPKFILFDDKVTYIQLSEQDYYCFHDCSYSARNIGVLSDARIWKIIYNNIDGVYPDANYDL
jgi:hypothetical protein